MAAVDASRTPRFSANNHTQRVPPADDLDDLFNYDADIDNELRNADPSAQRSNEQSNTRPAESNDAGGLGIDEEIKVRKARKPQPKLDEDRLLSDMGIPKLRRISKERLKFRGKGHEFTDVARLLNTYQLWLDDLYPKAKFADGLAIMEKLGHKKRMQVMRKAWIDEEKPSLARDDYSDADGDFIVHNTNAEPHRGEEAAENDSFIQNDHQEDVQHQRQQDSDHEELYRHSTPAVNETGGEPADDELDALLAGNVALGMIPNQTTRDLQAAERDDFADEEEAMADMW